MELRDKIIQELSEELELDKELIEQVISWSFKNANEAFRTNNQVELSGFGKFMLSKAKFRRQLVKLEQRLIDNSHPQYEEETKRRIEELKTRIR